MKKPTSNAPSPFSSSSHDAKSAGASAKTDAKLKGRAAGEVPDSVRAIMASNAAQSAARPAPGAGLPVVASSYKPSGKVGPFAFLPMLLVTLAGALLIGALYFFIEPHFNYLLVTQLYLGALVGGAVWLGAKAARARSSRYACAFAIVGTLLVFAVFHGGNIWQYREAMLDYYAPLAAKKSGQSPTATRAQLAGQLPLALAAQYYCEDNYADGVTLRDDKDTSGGGIRLTGPYYVALLLCEIGFTALIASAVATTATTARFSESQNRWYRRKRAFAVKPTDVWEVLRALQAEDFAGARQAALSGASKEPATGTVSISRVVGEAGGWVEMVVTQDKRPHLLYEAQVGDDKLRALGATI